MGVFVFQELPQLHIPVAFEFFSKDAVPAVADMDHQPIPTTAPTTMPTTIAAATASTIIRMISGLSFDFGFCPFMVNLLGLLLYYFIVAYLFPKINKTLLHFNVPCYAFVQSH